MPENIKKVLITGCSGFLGHHLTEALATEFPGGVELNGLTEEEGFVSPRMRVFHVDIRDRQKVFDAVETVRPDLTIHLAAIANVGFSWRHQQLTYEVNFLGTSNLLEALNKCSPLSRVLLMSSGELYGDTGGKMCSESTPLKQPQNPYAVSKTAMEMLGNLYTKASQLKIITLRAFNFTGPFQDKQFAASDFSHQIAAIERGAREPVIRVGNLSAVRDISDVRDVARYISVIAGRSEPGAIYNLCSGNTYAIREILEVLISLSGAGIEVVVDEAKFRPVDVPKLWGDSTLIREKFGLEPNYEIKQTLSDLLGYWRNNI